MEFGFLLLSQSRWDFHLYARVQIAVAVALEVFDAFAFDAKDCPRLSACGDLNDSLAFERGHFNFRPQCRLNEADRHFAVQIVAIALKNFVLSDMQYHIQIALQSPAKTSFSISRRTQPGAGVDSRRNFQFYFRRPLLAAFSVA